MAFRVRHGASVGAIARILSWEPPHGAKVLLKARAACPVGGVAICDGCALHMTPSPRVRLVHQSKANLQSVSTKGCKGQLWSPQTESRAPLATVLMQRKRLRCRSIQQFSHVAVTAALKDNYVCEQTIGAKGFLEPAESSLSLRDGRIGRCHWRLPWRR